MCVWDRERENMPQSWCGGHRSAPSNQFSSSMWVPEMTVTWPVWAGSAFPHWGQHVPPISYFLNIQNLKGEESSEWPLDMPGCPGKPETLPGTFWMIFATKALKWHRISFSVSESFSFSASRSCRVKSTYSSKVLLRKCVSLSRPPLALKIPKRRKQRKRDSPSQLK